jgi:GNAT superfamily N-acetyltransferase
MDLHIRPFTGSDSDYEAVVGVHNIVFPENTESVEDWRHWDSTRPAYCYMDRWLAEEDGQCIGFAHAVQFSGMYHPQKFFVDVRVLPAARRRGVGAQLYDMIMGRLPNPLALRTEIREDMPDGLAFLAARGYQEEMRGWDSRLDVAAFDPAPFATQAGRAEANGVQITTLADYMLAEPNHRRIIYEALVEMHRDVPRPDTYTPQPFEEWENQYFSDPHLMPEAYFIGVYQGQIAGVSQLWRSSMEDILYVGLTATRRDFRRMGIAMSLKLRTIALAKALGIREIRTGNESNNRPILNINEALGFVKQPAWITFVKKLD